MKGKHTPGPWFVDETSTTHTTGGKDTNQGYSIRTAENRNFYGKVIASMHAVDSTVEDWETKSRYDNETCKANAELIAKAPEMRELLNEIDTAFAVLAIGADHGITPQARGAINEAWPKIRTLLGYATDDTTLPKG